MPRHKPKDYPERRCENCEAMYKPRSHNQRVCSTVCRDEFSYDAYKRPSYLKKRTSDKPLRASYKKEWEKRHPDQEYTKEVVKLWHAAKARASVSGIDFTIEVYDLAIPEECPILRVPLEKGTRYAPSLDRIDSSKGYIRDNIWVISKLANRIKTDATLEELKGFAEWVQKL